jgi:hypothetical protein
MLLLFKERIKKKMKKLLNVMSLCLFLQLSSNVFGASGFENPRMAIVISKVSYDSTSGVKNVAMGWAAIANMSGIPYDCLFLKDVVKKEVLLKYDLVVLTHCSYIEETLYQAMVKNLPEYLSSRGKHLIIDGPFALYNEQGKERDHTEFDQLTGLEYAGFHGDSEFRIKVKSTANYITAPFEEKQFLSQQMVNGLDIIQFKDSPAELLLISTNEKEFYPFLSCREINNNRIVLISDFGIRSGISSFFRNSPHPVFYQNLIFNVLTRSVHWALYGNNKDPFPVPQVTNANLTAIIRLDADGSQNLEAQKQTLGYLTDLARETGVLSVYAFVTDWAAVSGWDNLAPLAQKLEEYGGQIGTHSKTHRVTGNKKWEEELTGSVQAIETNIKEQGYDIGKVDFFVNPGNSIPMEYNEEIAKRFSFYMTHGGEQAMPLGFGNLTWFTGSYKDLVILMDTPSPDYQWFYDGSWSYTTQQIVAYEEAIFDHMYENVGRGVIFDEMWHDYAITAIHDVEPPRTQSMRESGSRIINRSNIALYDAMKSKFLVNDIYCPGPVDLSQKLKAMARWNYNWKFDKNQLNIELDLSDVMGEEIANYTGGMGIKIENTNSCIQSVIINGEPHFAFADHMVILPNLNNGVNRIQVMLGSEPADVSRLIYTSKRMPDVKKSNLGLETQFLTKSKAKFSFNVKKPFILLNSDFQEWNRMGDNILKGYVTTDRHVVLAEHSRSDFYITRATLPISDFDISDSQINLLLKESMTDNSEIMFQTEKEPKKVTVGNVSIQIDKVNQQYKVQIPPFTNTQELIIVF